MKSVVTVLKPSCGSFVLELFERSQAFRSVLPRVLSITGSVNLYALQIRFSLSRGPGDIGTARIFSKDIPAKRIRARS